MASWRLAKSLEVLLAQVNQMYPHRDKSNDGTIGDTSHAARKSDHNPNGAGVVCAMDITHDPASGCDSYALAEQFRKVKDPRVQYVISNRKIANADVQNWKWRPYTGVNPHDHHVHVSVRQSAKFYDDKSAWDLGVANEPLPGSVHHDHPVLRRGSRGSDVSRVQYLVGITTDGVFGAGTKDAVEAFQEAHSLVADGVVGPQTWKVFDSMSSPWQREAA